MTQRVLFNGAVLVLPGAATKIDASQFQNIVLSGVGTVGLIGEADGGQPRTVQVFVTPAAVKAFYKSGDLVEAAAIAAAPGNDPRIPNGASVIVCYKVNNSLGSSLTHAATLQFKSLQYGILTNNITVALADGVSPANSRIVTITTLDDFGAQLQEISPVLGGTGYLTLVYTGAAAASTVTITATTLTTTNTGAVDQLNLLFTDYANLSALIQAINATGKYTATALVTNAPSFDPSNLDAVTTVDIKAGAATLFARNYDIASWVNLNSQIASVVLTKGQTSPVAVLATTQLTGGTRGTSANTDWVNGFSALRGVRINQLAPLASADATTPQGSFTYVSILASLTAHCKFVSSTAGRNECQGWSGMSGTKANIVTQLNLQNSPHVCMVGQKTKLQRTSDGNIVTMPEWALAVTCAGLRAGAPLGEPLTWKWIQSFGLTSDSSWSSDSVDDVTSMILNGLLVVQYVKNKNVFRIVKGITTFTAQDNDAYTEETIVQTWKAISFDVRTALEDTFVGRGGTVQLVASVPPVMDRVFQLHRRAGSITDSIVGGVTTPAARKYTASLSGDTLSCGATFSPTPGINFALTTLVLVPAQISL